MKMTPSMKTLTSHEHFLVFINKYLPIYSMLYFFQTIKQCISKVSILSTKWSIIHYPKLSTSKNICRPLLPKVWPIYQKHWCIPYSCCITNTLIKLGKVNNKHVISQLLWVRVWAQINWVPLTQTILAKVCSRLKAGFREDLLPSSLSAACSSWQA